jgi:uncharacterized protein YqfA (UPF0365 family)
MGVYIGLIIGALFLLIFVFIIGNFINLWLQALFSKADISLASLIGMRLRKIPPRIMVEAKITGVKAGLTLETAALEAHFLAGGHVPRVIQALVAADKANIPLDFQRGAAIDLAGRNVLEAVQMSVNPKVIETPSVMAMAKDGIQLKAIARVTVRANLDKLVGGAGEETIIARVGEGIVSTIGSSGNHKSVLENPDLISQGVLTKGLDTGTAYDILSIDIADVDVGKNIGAELETDRAEADKKIAQAKAEERRALAIASEQEMRAKVVDMESKVVEAEAQVPLAMADAFRSGNIGVMDYYQMKNIQSDTKMRERIAEDEEPKQDNP